MANLGVTLNWVVLATLVITTLLSISFIWIDLRKKRKIKKFPFISFMVPTHNDGEYVGEAIKTVYESYNPKKFELIIINDKSTDDTPKILARLGKQYNFKLINNKVNKGKAASINDSVKEAKGEIILVLDSDSILNKKSIYDIIARFESNPKVGGVSCYYQIRNKRGFLPIMQNIEYSMLGFIQSAYNLFSTISLWGGCMAFRRRAFLDIGKLSTNFLTEDMDSALKLNEHGWKVEQSYYPVLTYAPSDFKTWYKQKLRWCGGGMQCLIKHYKIYLKNPLVILFLVSLSLFAIRFIYGIVVDFSWIKNFYGIISDLSSAGQSIAGGLWHLMGIYSLAIIEKLLIALSYPLFTIPYMLYDEFYRKKPLRLLLAFPYALVYYPLFLVVAIIGFSKAIMKYRALERGERAW